MTNGPELRLELFVDDSRRSASFYERVLGFQRDKEEPGYIAVCFGTVRIGLGLMADLPDSHPLKTRPNERRGVGVELVLEVDDVDAVFAVVRASGEAIDTSLQERPWGLRDFRLVDPDGYYIRVTSAR